MTPEQQQKITQLVADYKIAFGTVEGKRVLDDLAGQCHETLLTYVDGNPNGSAFNEGKRFVILHIRRLVASDLNNNLFAKGLGT